MEEITMAYRFCDLDGGESTQKWKRKQSLQEKICYKLYD